MSIITVLRQEDIHCNQINRRRLPYCSQLQLRHPARCATWRGALCLDLVQQARKPRNVHELCLGDHQGRISKAQSWPPRQSSARVFLVSSTNIPRQYQRSWKLQNHRRPRVKFPLPGPDVEGSVSGKGYVCEGPADFLGDGTTGSDNVSLGDASNSSGGGEPGTSNVWLVSPGPSTMSAGDSTCHVGQNVRRSGLGYGCTHQ